MHIESSVIYWPVNFRQFSYPLTLPPSPKSEISSVNPQIIDLNGEYDTLLIMRLMCFQTRLNNLNSLRWSSQYLARYLVVNTYAYYLKL